MSAVPARPSAGIAVVDVQKLMVFTISEVPARPSAIGVVDVQKLTAFYDFWLARATLCEDGRGGSHEMVVKCYFFKSKCGL